ncbi:hypothetical protein CNMCM6936_002355 [Aspergillus lentulus]|uniref:Sterigmatocystin biosynthesis P450 monooxygenase n=1 Tax=Aspergillus lentulus TaxID=293939 RepID=A0AAN5YSA8_ASPLE|nr:hypothetical protein CNMCM6069_007894 [Aspergillus lentulus]KAF4162255.1 hypothetical protein CNMCM6936_002355 [Aspergillus lentulus]KAF4188533.1 hypothetical protein CNMCM7927_001228 [Aspergillus lentulus]KAF4206941.1 hypothetical protein CNMCM8927_004036 [Aspergillus lentulus]GFF77359.1 sterigmatocystin biosynthesis P450 monooxygenase [Aspergillus lentulus]
MEQIWIYTVVILALWITQKTYNILNSPLRLIPGPFFTKLTRLPLKLSIISGRRIYFVHHLHEKYGPIVRISPNEVSISSIADFKEIHRIGAGFLKSEWYSKFVMSQRPGVFDMRDPAAHAARRKLFARAFSKSELRNTWEKVVREKVRVAVGKIQEEMKNGGRSDVFKWWTFLATDVSGRLMFGEDFGMLSYGKKNDYIHVLESTMKGSGINAELPFIGFVARYLPITSLKSMFRASDYLATYGRRAITNARGTSTSSRNIFAGIIAESEKGASSLTEEDVVTEAGNLIVAGSDTTAVTLTYLVWAILSQPKLQQELEEEVAGLDEEYEDADIERLPLLNAAIKESLRLYGAAPGSLPRSVPAGGATLSKYFIPEGTTVSTQSYTIHRDKNIFPDPEVFKLQRWLGEDDTKCMETAFSPFGAGARTCLGIHLAYMELRLAVAEFFRHCRGTKLAEDITWETMKPENYFLIAPVGHRCEVVSK